jgi:hypothetical protein
MAVCEKTVGESSVTEICTKSNYIYEPEHPIFKVYCGGIFRLFFAKPTRRSSAVRGDGQLFLAYAGRGLMKQSFIFDFIARSYDRTKQRLAWKPIGE